MYKKILFLIILTIMPFYPAVFLYADSWYEPPDNDMYTHPLLDLYKEKENYATGKIINPAKKANGHKSVRIKVTSPRCDGRIIEALIFDDGYISDSRNNKRVLLSYSKDISDAMVVDSDRTVPIKILCALFVLSVLLVGGFKKITGLLALALSAAFIAFIFIPFAIRGWSPLLLASLSVFIITVSTVFAISRFGRKSLSAIIGTFSSVAVVLMLGMIYYPLAHIDGFALGPVQILNYFSRNYLNYSIHNFQQLMLGILIIGSTGMIIDVTVCVSSTLEQIVKKNPAVTRPGLIKIGMVTGREIAGALANSLILAYFGAELIPLISNTIFIHSAAHLFNNEWFFITVFQAFAGSIGILLSVPLTSLACAWLLIPKKNKICPAYKNT